MPDATLDQAETAEDENKETATVEDTTPAVNGDAGELPDPVKATLKKLRDEVKAEKAKAKASEAKAKELESANLSEKERAEQKAADATARADEADARARESLLRATVLENATEFRNPTLALDIVRNKIEFNDEGEPTNVRESLAELLTAEPYMKRGIADIGATSPESNRKGSIKQEDLKSMSVDEINKARTDGLLDHLL